jgi:hypothetical protein
MRERAIAVGCDPSETLPLKRAAGLKGMSSQLFRKGVDGNLIVWGESEELKVLEPHGWEKARILHALHRQSTASEQVMTINLERVAE